MGMTGWPCNRIYVVMLHKSYGKVLHDPIDMYQRIKSELQNRTPTSARDYMTATPRDVELAAMRIAANRCIDYQPDA